MDVILISFICAISYLIILLKMFGLNFIARTQLIWDLVFTFGIPFLFLGTYSGMATAFLSGVFFSIMTFILDVVIPRKPIFRFPYGKTKNSKTSYGVSSPTRS